MKAVMVMFDSLNRQFLPNYGCEWVKGPNFKRLGERCTTFDDFYAGSTPCMPARRELHTGRYNFLHRSWGPLEPFDVSMPEILKKAGVYTHLVTDHFHYFEDGGATYHSRYSTWEGIRGQQGDPWHGKVADPVIPDCQNPRQFNLDNWRQDWVNREVMTTETTQPMPRCFGAGIDFIRRNQAEDRWFLQLETFDPHEPFFTQEAWKALYPHDYDGAHYDWINYGPIDDDEPTVRHIRMQYAALLSMCDAYLGRILDLFDELNLWRDTMLIVNTDHGLMLGEKEWYGKNVQPFYDEIVRIPCFIHDPRNPNPGERRKALCQTIDLAPTLLEFFQIEIPDTMQGRPLSGVMADDTPIRDAALFGIHGGHVNVVDSDYIYMRANVTRDNSPLNEYTLMPTHMRDRFPVSELTNIKIARKGSFDFIRCDVMRIPCDSPFGSDAYGHLLFDRHADPLQENPLDDREAEMRMARKLVRLMEESEAPHEQFKRLGLKRRGRIRERDLRPNRTRQRFAMRATNARGPLTMDSPLEQWLEDERGARILADHLGDITSHPMVGMMKRFSILRIQELAKGKIPDKLIEKIRKDLEKG